MQLTQYCALNDINVNNSALGDLCVKLYIAGSLPQKLNIADVDFIYPSNCATSNYALAVILKCGTCSIWEY